MNAFVCVVAVAVKFTRKLTDVIVTSADQKAKFECELSKDGVKLNWLKDNVQLYTDDRVRTEDNGRKHQLVIKQVRSQDVGQYTAVYEKQRTTATLSVIGELHSFKLFFDRLRANLQFCVPRSPTTGSSRP